MATHHAGQVLNERKKGAVLWQARISADRNRLEVIGVIEASTTAIEIQSLTERELCELLQEPAGLQQRPGGLG